MKTINLKQGSQEWLDFRKNGVGASEIAGIAGITGAFQKRHEILAEKLGRVRELSDFQKRIFADGHEWENVVRENLNAGGEANFIPEVAISEQEPRFFASLDGYDAELGLVLEVKSVTTAEKFKAYCDRTPEHYEAQIQWQLFITGAKGATLAFVHDGQVVKKYVTADQAMQAKLAEAGKAFLAELDAIKAGTLPNPNQMLATPDMERLAKLARIKADMKIQLDTIEEEVKALSEKIIEEQKANRVESDEITIQVVERQGAIQYGKIPEVQRLGEAYLSAFRAKGSKSIQVKLKGTNQ